ncbi:MFS transporter [Halovenus sp. WSH3]|uniref:MFS transporter n=1 Tax=Halovenus carboxidivorans TaxID=2692199 RepID=A0A6B0T5B4_9EURY|nr:MFS transporter [Halovenus carboxidivorans]MXR51376.1 MFS transporter [Halovenus carboxidivorans]
MNANDRKITGFTMAGHAMVHTYELSVPIMMTVWLVEFAANSATLGTVVAVGYGLFGVGALPGGLLVDRFGSRRLIVACLVGMGLSFLLLSIAPGIVGITLALGLWGLSASVYHPAGLSLISKAVDQRGSAFAYHGMAGNIGIAAGPFVTAILLVAVDWRMAAVILAVPALLAALAGLTVEFDETAAVAATDGGRHTADIDSFREFVSASRGLFTVGFATVFALVLFNGLYYRGMLTFLPEMLGEFLEPLVDIAPEEGIGPIPDGRLAREFDLAQYLYAGLLAVGIGGQYVGGRLTDTVSVERGLALMLGLLGVIALLFVPAAGTLPTLLLVSVALGFVLFAMQPLSQATIAKYSPPERRGLSFGYTYLAIFGIGALGASIVGTVLTYASTTAVFVLLAGFEGIALALALSLIVRE